MNPVQAIALHAVQLGLGILCRALGPPAPRLRPILGVCLQAESVFVMLGYSYLRGSCSNQR